MEQRLFRSRCVALILLSSGYGWAGGHFIPANCVANVVHGAYAHDPSSFGSHNAFADLVPIALLLAGSGLWAGTAISTRRRALATT